jgi:hypothetical protein
MGCDGRTPEDSNRNLPQVLPAVAGSMEQVCACVQGPYCEADQLSVAVCRTITMQYHCVRELFDCFTNEHMRCRVACAYTRVCVAYY